MAKNPNADKGKCVKGLKLPFVLNSSRKILDHLPAQLHLRSKNKSLKKNRNKPKKTLDIYTSFSFKRVI